MKTQKDLTRREEFIQGWVDMELSIIDTTEVDYLEENFGDEGWVKDGVIDYEELKRQVRETGAEIFDSAESQEDLYEYDILE